MIERLRAYYATQEDPYAGGDMENARRLGAVLWTVAVCLVVALLPISPPTDEIGAGGWAVAAAVVSGGIAFVFSLRRGQVRRWETLYVAGCVTLAGLSLMQWLAGGIGAPYERLYLIPVILVGALSTPRLIAAFMGLVLLALTAPFVYGGWNSVAAGASVASYGVWWFIAITGNLLMTGVRAQRLSMAREGAEAREEARRDPLTGLGNRRGFDEAAERELAQSLRLGVPLSLLLIDIEHFKRVNDDHGHLAGDRCLQEVAAAIRQEVRAPDLCFRWGGDEFAVILTGTDAAGAKRLGERLGAAVSESCRRPEDEPVVVRSGVAELGKDVELKELVELADLALSAARSTADQEGPS